MAQFLFYAGSGIDRSAELRRDEGLIDAILADPATLVVPLWRSLCAVASSHEARPVALPAADLRALVERADELVFLGRRDGAARVALDLSAIAEDEVRSALGGDLRDLRLFGAMLDPEDASLLAYARAILHWHRQHRFCGACGAPTRSEVAGHVRRCTACHSEHFPRTDPAVIMLVEDPGGDRCLLARQSRWPPGMVSTLAGFLEPGESLEEAVAREVREEAGVAVREIRYQASQPWPFPCSIMLGFRARAASTELAIDHTELEHADWFSRADVRNFQEADFANWQPPTPGTWLLPPRDSIARWLIERWLEDVA